MLPSYRQDRARLRDNVDESLAGSAAVLSHMAPPVHSIPGRKVAVSSYRAHLEDLSHSS